MSRCMDVAFHDLMDPKLLESRSMCDHSRLPRELPREVMILLLSPSTDDVDNEGDSVVLLLLLAQPHPPARTTRVTLSPSSSLTASILFGSTLPPPEASVT